MKLSKLLPILAVLVLGTLPVFAQVNDTYVIPAAANARGAFGTHWMTRFSIFNPHLDDTLTVSITYIPSGGAPGIEELVDVPPNSTAWSDNILEDLFGVSSGSGSLLVATFAEDNPGLPDDILSRSFLVNTDTFNNRPDGTYGQTIPGEWAGLMDYDSDGISSISQGVRNAGSYRVNVGAVNLGRCAATLYVTAYNAGGQVVLDAAPFYLPPLGHMQDRLPVTIDRATLEFFVDDPCAADDERYAIVFPYTSMIDQQTGDPSYQYPTLLASPGVLYAKAQTIEPTSIGKKIDSNYARNVRAQAKRGTGVKLVRTEQGLQITK